MFPDLPPIWGYRPLATQRVEGNPSASIGRCYEYEKKRSDIPLYWLVNSTLRWLITISFKPQNWAEPTQQLLLFIAHHLKLPTKLQTYQGKTTLNPPPLAWLFSPKALQAQRLRWLRRLPSTRRHFGTNEPSSDNLTTEQILRHLGIQRSISKRPCPSTNMFYIVLPFTLLPLSHSEGNDQRWMGRDML